MADQAEDRLQVLVLHGRQSNANLASFQLTGFKSALGKDVDFHFLEGKTIWRYEPGVDLHDADPMSVSLSKGSSFKVWFTYSSDEQRGRPDIFRQQDPNVNVFYKDAEAAADELLERICKGSRIHAVVALFEGSIVVHLAVAKLMKEGLEVPWPLSVFFGSLPIRDDRLAATFADGRKARHHSIHVFGQNDEYYFYGRRAAGRVPPEDYYEAPLVLEHEEGHRLPNAQPASGVLYAQIAAEMRHCRGLPSSGGEITLHNWQRARRPPKPIAPPVLDMEQMLPRKLRILALCGGHSCAEMLRVQTSALRHALGRDSADWTFIEGTEDWKWFEGEPVLSEMEKKLAKGNQLKNWYKDTVIEANPTNRPNREKQFDPTTRVIYYDIPEKVEILKRRILDDGPFDVVVAFSQGSIMMHLLIGHLRRELPGPQELRKRWQCTRNEAEMMPWRLTVFFCGMHIRAEDYFNLFHVASPHPTVHVFGKEDEFYAYGRDGFGNKPMEEYYVDPLVLVHEQGHQFPTAQPRAKQIYDRVAAEIWRHCGRKRTL